MEGAASIPQSIETLVEAFASLPSVGPVAAERLAFFLLGLDRKEAFSIAGAVEALSEKLRACGECGSIGTEELCAVCSDANRDRGILLVVERIEHVALFEKTRSYGGLYHVLGPVPKKEPEKAEGIKELEQRVKRGTFREVVLALNPTKAGDAAAVEIAGRLEDSGVVVSRIGQGVVPGGSFRTADAGAVAESILSRKTGREDEGSEAAFGGKLKSPAPGIPGVITEAVEAVKRLPGIGTRTAERIVFHLVALETGGDGDGLAAKTLAGAIRDVKTKLSNCRICGNVGDVNPCEICSDVLRDASRICVVASPQDAIRIERTGAYNGQYHVLGGLFAPLDGVEAGDLNLRGLEQRLRDSAVREIIIATDPTFSGDGTALLVGEIAAKRGVKASRIGSGVLRGGDLRFASTLQLEHALSSRRAMKKK